MLAARRLLEKGWQTVYAPEAEILYYRNDNLRELWKRNFDIGVAHAEHPEMIENTKPGKEGMRLVRVTSALLKQNHMEEYLGEVAGAKCGSVSCLSFWKTLCAFTGTFCPEMLGK